MSRFRVLSPVVPLALLGSLLVGCGPQRSTPTGSTEVTEQLNAARPVAVQGVDQPAYISYRLKPGAPNTRSGRKQESGALVIAEVTDGKPSMMTVPRSMLARVRALPWLEILEIDTTASPVGPAGRVGPMSPATYRLITETIPWGVNDIVAPTVHSWGIQGSGILVGVLDDGINCTHPDLVGRIVGGWDGYTNSSNYCVGGAHGTPVAGIIAASINGSQVIGVAPQASLFVMRGCTTDQCDYTAMYDALNHLPTNAKVINISLADCGWPLGGPTADVKNKLTEFLNAGVQVVIAAGNGMDTAPPVGPCPPNAPVSKFASWDPRLIVVSAYSSVTGQAEPGYQYGPEVDIAGPTRVETDRVDGGIWISFGGTSAATPHGAGAVALALSAEFSSNVAFTRIWSTAVNPSGPGQDTLYGWGKMRLNDAIKPKPQISSVSWCFGSGAITVAGTCEFTSTAAFGINPPFLYKYEVTRSDQPGVTIYDWGSATRDIAVGAGDYTLTVKVSVYEPAYNRLGGYQIREIPVCTGAALLEGPLGGGEQTAAAVCGGQGES